MTYETIVTQTRDFIVENFLYTRPEFDLSEDVSLLREGIVDSMGVMEVIMFLESTFDLSVDDGDIREENLGSLAGIARLVIRKREAGPTEEVQAVHAA